MIPVRVSAPDSMTITVAPDASTSDTISSVSIRGKARNAAGAASLLSVRT